MTARKPPPMAMTVHAGWDIGSDITTLDSGGALFAPLTAEYTSEVLKITIVVEVLDGKPTCTEYNVERIDGGGLELMTTEVMRGINLRALMANACAVAALQTEDGHGYTKASTVEAVEAVVGPLRRQRKPTTDAELEDFAEAFRRDFKAGHMAEFAESRHYSERQAYRLLKLARTRGFLPDSKEQ